MDTTLERINRKDIMKVSGFLKELDGSKMLDIVNRYMDDRYLRDWYKDDLVFWEKRNEFMCKRLMDHLDQNKGKKIIVLCGLHHKYYINNYLSHHPQSSQIRIQTTSD
jgi:pheromone shutdown protein TraB